MVSVRVPAKVNLFLGVGAPRDDGFHEVTTVLQAVSLYDDVFAVPGEDVTCTVAGEGAGLVPPGDGNLAVAAARLLAERTGVAPAVALRLDKDIPVAGGMAGGSADAAGALVACDALWQSGATKPQLAELAAELGSDVPFLLSGGTALGVGRGEQLTPVLARGSYHWVFALADRGLATEKVYAEHDRQPPPAPVQPDDVLAALRSGDVKALAAALHNDLQAAALRLRPSLQRTLDTGLDLGAVGAVLSGSGPTCAFLVADEEAGVALAAALAGAGVCRSVRTATGPVPGARVTG